MKKIKLEDLEITSFSVNPDGESGKTVKGGYLETTDLQCDSTGQCESAGGCTWECNSFVPCTDGWECYTSYACDQTQDDSPSCGPAETYTGSLCSEHPCIT